MKNADKFFIDGAWVAPSRDELIDVINPATEKVVAQIANGSSVDVDKAVIAAQKAFESFSQTSIESRLKMLERIREGLINRTPEIARLISVEMGAPMSFARDAQAATCVAHADAMIAVLKDFNFEQVVGNTLITKEPIGVVGLIAPWNWPLNQVVCKVLPALASGCTIVLKPSEVAPLDAILFADILTEAGVPPGVFNLVNGDGPSVGHAISTHPGIHMVSFTGSTRAGIQVAKAAADTVKRVTQELGGKSPNIILDDADLATVVKAGVEHCFSNSGQSCDAPTLMYVPAALYHEAVSIAAKAGVALQVGNPDSEDTDLGPVANRNQFNRIQELIKSGITQGARAVIGGEGRPDDLKEGFYVKPTIFADATPDMRIVQEEIFGPVLVILPYDDEKALIDAVNAADYGLAAYVQSGSLERARKVARQIRAGSVYINSPEWNSLVPFGGFRQSGNGRECGAHGLSEYLEIKASVGYF
ncbi:aldehyde dehydrogenase family protein [Pseudomonas plecoglossicida]|uniref:aldehyde dehydrogenase family protein n=1 Tax=Pseudomonas plecoglossicida TaxID=70775 RepID=UPI0039773549